MIYNVISIGDWLDSIESVIVIAGCGLMVLIDWIPLTLGLLMAVSVTRMDFLKWKQLVEGKLAGRVCFSAAFCMVMYKSSESGSLGSMNL